MKYILIMRVSDAGIEAQKSVPFEEMLASMGQFNESLVQAGVIAGGDGLAPAEEGYVVDFSGATPEVTQGAYGETESLFNGYWILDVENEPEALEWAKRCPLGVGAKLEVRRIPGIDEFPEDNEWVQKEKEWTGAAESDASTQD